MNTTDAFTIQAFTAVLPKLDVVLSEDLKQTIHATGSELAQHHFSQAASTMRDLVRHHRCLSDAYAPVYRKFQERYLQPSAAVQSSSDEANVSASDTSANRSPARPSERTESDSGTLSDQPSSLFPESWLERLTVPILTADNFVRPARILVRQARTHRHQIPESMHLFVMLLQRAIATFEEQTHQVLRALEHQLLTTEDIAHALNMPLDQAERIVQMLLREGYIDSAQSNMLGRAMAAFMPASRVMPDVHPSTHFVLTSKGFFHLNPLLTGRHSEDELE